MCVLRAACVGLVLMLLVGCSVRRSDLVGAYTAEYEVIKESLVLREDGTFSQAVSRSTSSRCTARGTWALERDGQITFRGMIVFWWDPVGADCPEPGTVSLPTGWLLGPYIEVSDRFLYRKTRSAG